MNIIIKVDFMAEQLLWIALDCTGVANKMDTWVYVYVQELMNFPYSKYLETSIVYIHVYIS